MTEQSRFAVIMLVNSNVIMFHTLIHSLSSMWCVWGRTACFFVGWGGGTWGKELLWSL